MALPVIDFSDYGLNVEDPSSVPNQDLEKLADDVYDALSTWGFMYLRGHGIGQNKVDGLTKMYKTFFDLPCDFKKKYSTFGGKFNGIHGWSAVAREKTNPDKPFDLKESFDAQPFRHAQGAKIWPSHPDVPNFEEVTFNFFEECKNLSLRILDIIAIGLQLEDRDYFSRCHADMKYDGNYTGLRNIYYPPVTQDVLPGQLRCAEHTDYGSLTILFQDNVGGLEVWCKKTEEYVPAKPLPGCVLVNIGDMMQRWTGSQLVATKHRVVIPKDEGLLRKGRQSVAFFVHPNEDTMIVPLVGPNKRSPVLSGVYAQRRFNETYLS